MRFSRCSRENFKRLLGRFLRFGFNNVLDEPGRYFYVRDRQSGKFWSSSWLPVALPLDEQLRRAAS